MCTKIKLIKSRLFLLCAILTSFLFLSCIFGIKVALDSPKNIKVSDITSNSALVTWSSVKHAQSYEVMWTRKDNENWNFATVMENGIMLEGLTFDQDYTVQVCANPPDDSVFYTISDYNKTEFTTLMDETPDGEFARPANIKASFNKDKSSITVTWDPVEGASYYDINFDFGERYSPASYKIPKTVPASQTEFTYIGTMYGSYVNISVAARNSDFSDTCRWSREVRLDF